MAADDVTEPAVRALIAAINAGDREAFFAALTPDATNKMRQVTRLSG